RRQCPVAGGGAVDVPHWQGHDRVGLDQAAGQRVVEHALEQAAYLACGGVEALFLLAPDDAAHVLGSNVPDWLAADVRQDVLFQVAARHGHVLAVARLDVLEEALGELGYGGVFCAGYLGLLFLLRRRSPIATCSASSSSCKPAFFSVRAGYLPGDALYNL